MSIILGENTVDRAEWNRFVEAHEQSRFCHLFEYNDVVSCYGYKPVRLGFRKQGQLVAVLPASRANSLLFGKKLVSQPFSEYGGLLVDAALRREDVAELETLLTDYLAQQHGVRSLELHGIQGVPLPVRGDTLVQQNPHHVAVLNIDRSPDLLWKEVVEYSVRKGVNKARAQGLEAFQECTPEIIRDRFFPLYLESMKRLGVPPHSIDYYLRCCSLLGERMKIFWARKDGEILAGLLGFVCGRRVNIINIVSHADSWKYSPNDLIHWEFIQWAALSGLKFFDFGSVRYEGQRTYKKKWGTSFEEHAYYFLFSKKDADSKGTFSSSSAGMTKLANFWSEYVPRPMARLVGPLIRKQLVR